MNSISRVAVLLAIVAVLAAAVPASARPMASAEATLAATFPTAITSSPAPCSDTKYNLIGPRWKQTLSWSYKSSSTPSYLTTASVVQVLKRAFVNITRSDNDCGLADQVSATSDYLGTTSNSIGVTKAGACGSSDGANTVGFGALPAGYLALTCVRSVGTSIVEADIRLGSGVTWALDMGTCFNDFMLEAVATHEIGHAFGLDHVGETNHGRLTMSTYIDGTCENQESSLGNGDVKALRALY